MVSIADSDAFLSSERMLVQHQSALTILQGMVTDPDITEIKWLDLASGRGQIIAQLERNLSEDERNKIHFQGYDVENAHTRQAARLSENLKLSNASFEIGELSTFHEHVSTQGPWDFLTLTNTIHEISPSSLSQIFVNCLMRLSERGCLFIYDMESLPSPELGAVLWTAPEIRSILTKIFEEFGCVKYRPAIGTWSHKTCDGWNVQVKRKHIDFPEGYAKKNDHVIMMTTNHIETILKEKFSQIKGALESLTKFGAETSEESQAKEKLLFDYWAVSRALEVTK